MNKIIIIITIVFVQEKGIECILDDLKQDSTSFPYLERNWKATINYRLNYIKNSSSTNNTLKMWKQYLVPYGHKLLRDQNNYT